MNDAALYQEMVQKANEFNEGLLGEASMFGPVYAVKAVAQTIDEKPVIFTTHKPILLLDDPAEARKQLAELRKDPKYSILVGTEPTLLLSGLDLSPEDFIAGDQTL